jgi:hypothetical protein
MPTVGRPGDADPLEAALALGKAIAAGATAAEAGLASAIRQGYDISLIAGVLAGHDPEVLRVAARAARAEAAIDRCAAVSAPSGPVPLGGGDLVLLDPATGEPAEGPAMYPLVPFKDAPRRAGGPRPAWWGRADGRRPRFVDANGKLLMGAPRPSWLRLPGGRIPMYVDGRVVWSEGVMAPWCATLPRKKRYFSMCAHGAGDAGPGYAPGVHSARVARGVSDAGRGGGRKAGGGGKAGDSDDDLSEVD